MIVDEGAARTPTPTSSAQIRLLPPSVADAIAAGEVVERPASVVRELCDNAIDAGARHVVIEIDGAGLVRIRVADDGHGIAPDEIGLAVQRHATSKIASSRDLETVSTLGFRGEALASITAVAGVTLTSRRAEDGVGRRLRVRHGEMLGEEAWGGPPGTAVEVLDLFASTPARLRFLRSARAETAACLQVVQDVVLAHPGVSVTCTIDGVRRLRHPGGTLDDALHTVLGGAGRQLVAVAETGDINVGGAISPPDLHRGTRSALVLVVNGRRVHNRALVVAVSEAYRGLLPGGRHPFGVVSVALDARDVDVNVHPAKREVRFRDEGAVFAAVQRACWEALGGAAPPHLSLTLGEAGAAYSSRARPDASGAEPLLWGVSPRSGPQRAMATSGPLMPRWAPPPHDRALDGGAAPATAAGTGRPPHLEGLHSLGQVAGRWMVAAGDAVVVIVDPHAAHEKVLYARLLSAWGRRDLPAQLLLQPVLVEVDTARMDRFSANGEILAACGFTVDTFGPSTLRCTAVPLPAAGADPARLLGELLDSLGGGPPTEQRHRAAALVACHGAVRFGDVLGSAAQQQLLEDLAATPGALTCPHGRPTMVVLDDAELRRIFRRPGL